MADSSDIDNALVAKLGADVQLLALMPNGAYMDKAPPGLTRFVVVSLVAPRDIRQFGGRSFEDVMYLVKAVALKSSGGDVKAAAARIDELLDPQPPAPPATLSVPGYTLMTMHRDEDVARIRETEEDEVDLSIVWFHRGGHYHVVVST